MLRYFSYSHLESEETEKSKIKKEDKKKEKRTDSWIREPFNNCLAHQATNERSMRPMEIYNLVAGP